MCIVMSKRSKHEILLETMLTISPFNVHIYYEKYFYDTLVQWNTMYSIKYLVRDMQLLICIDKLLH